MGAVKGPSLSCTGESLGTEFKMNAKTESSSTELDARGHQKAGNNKLTEVYQNQVAFVF